MEWGESRVKQGRWRRDRSLLTISLLGELTIYIPPALEDAPKRGCASSSPSCGRVDSAPPVRPWSNAASPRPAIGRSLQVRGENHATNAHLELSSLLCLRACTTQNGTRPAHALRLAKHLPCLIASLRYPQVYSSAPGGVDQGSMENERMTVP